MVQGCRLFPLSGVRGRSIDDGDNPRSFFLADANFSKVVYRGTGGRDSTERGTARPRKPDGVVVSGADVVMYAVGSPERVDGEDVQS